MNMQFADNIHLHLCDVINNLFTASREVRIAVAFVKYSGLQLIASALDKCLEDGGEIEFIVGLDFHTTDAQSLRILNQKTADTNRFRLYCYSDPSDDTNVYHPKLYLFNTRHWLKSVIGSSNLTRGGLKDNVEINAILDFDLEDENAQTLLDIYAQIKYQPTRFAPDDDYLAAYEDISKRVSFSRQTLSSDEGIRKALDFLRKKEQTLPKSFTDPNLLRGWQKLVFEKLPMGEFHTNDLYQYSLEFQRTYPRNYNVEAKIRQTLQFLRNSGLVKHLGPNRWTKQRVT